MILTERSLLRHGTYEENVIIDIEDLFLIGGVPADPTVNWGADGTCDLKGGFAGDTGTGFDVRAKGVTISGFVIEGFDVGIQLNLQDKDLDIDASKDFTATNNTIKKNKVGIKSYNSLPGVVLNYNVFEDNDYAIENDEGKGGSQYVDARYNYWGCDEGPYIEVIFEEETTTCIDWNKKDECVQYETTKVSRFYQYVAGTPPDKGRLPDNSGS